MTESTSLLTSTQAAARLGVKTATLYAYVSRGLLPRHRSPDGRTSLFDVADVARLEKRSGAHRSAPSDVTVASELTLIDPAEGRLWFRGVDVLRACRQLHFEEIAWWLWTGSFDRATPWHADARSLLAGGQAQATLKRGASPADRLSLIAASVAVTHSSRSARAGTAAASDLMACLVDCVPGPSATGGRSAVKLAAKLAPRGMSTSLIEVLDAALSLLCEHGLTHPALVARLTTSAGGGIASAVAAAMSASSASVRSLAAIETAVATTAGEGPVRGADALDAGAVAVACSKDPYRSGDPRASVLLQMLAEAAPVESTVVSSLANELQKRSSSPPTAAYALAGLTWSSGMPSGSAGAIALVSRAAGWIAHALEEQRRPTPYRPRLAYTGAPPRSSTPRRAIDAVRDYLARE